MRESPTPFVRVPRLPARDARPGHGGDAYHVIEMPHDAVSMRDTESLELPVAELLRRARPLPPLEGMVIDDLTEEEAEAFLTALRS